MQAHFSVFGRLVGLLVTLEGHQRTLWLIWLWGNARWARSVLCAGDDMGLHFSEYSYSVPFGAENILYHGYWHGALGAHRHASSSTPHLMMTSFTYSDYRLLLHTSVTREECRCSSIPRYDTVRLTPGLWPLFNAVCKLIGVLV